MCIYVGERENGGAYSRGREALLYHTCYCINKLNFLSAFALDYSPHLPFAKLALSASLFVFKVRDFTYSTAIVAALE